MMGIFRKKDFVMGLDIGLSSIKMAIFSHKGKSLVLEKVGLKEIALTHEAHARTKLMTSALGELLDGIDVKKADCTICINSDQMVTKIVQTPLMPLEELSAALKLDSKQHFDIAVEDAYFDFDVLGEVTEEGVKKLRVAVAMAPKKNIADTLKLLKRAGIQPTSVISAGNALRKLLDLSSLKADPLCLADLAEQHTELAIIKDKSLAFFRKIPITSQDFTKAMTQQLSTERGSVQLSFEEAEKLKREVGIPESNDEELIFGKISTHELMSLLRVPLEHLAEEMHRCFGYYRETSDEDIDTLFLFGRGSLLKGLKVYISKELGIKVETIESLEKLNIASKIELPEGGVVSYARALGAGLSVGEGIHFLPPEIRFKTERTIKRLALGVGLVALTLLALTGFINLKSQLGAIASETQLESSKLAQLKRDFEKAHIQMSADELISREPYWEDVFKELSHRVPTEIRLTEWKYGADKPLTLSGYTDADKARELEASLRRMNNGMFKNTKLTKRKLVRDGSEEVEISFELE